MFIDKLDKLFLSFSKKLQIFLNSLQIPLVSHNSSSSRTRLNQSIKQLFNRTLRQRNWFVQYRLLDSLLDLWFNFFFRQSTNQICWRNWRLFNQPRLHLIRNKLLLYPRTINHPSSQIRYRLLPQISQSRKCIIRNHRLSERLNVNLILLNNSLHRLLRYHITRLSFLHRLLNLLLRPRKLRRLSTGQTRRDQKLNALIRRKLHIFPRKQINIVLIQILPHRLQACLHPMNIPDQISSVQRHHRPLQRLDIIPLFNRSIQKLIQPKLLNAKLQTIHSIHRTTQAGNNPIDFLL